MRNTVVPAAAFVASMLGAVLPAKATLQIAWDFGGTTGGCLDNSSCDLDPLTGSLQLGNQLINGVQVNGSLQTSTKAAAQNILNTSSLSVINTNATSIAAIVTVSDTGFIGPVELFNTAGSGTWQNAVGSTVTLNWYDDAANNQGADTAGDTPGTLIDTFTSTAALVVDSFNHNGSGAVSDGAQFSMTEQITGTLTAGAELLNRGQTEVKSAVAVPEPGSLLLLGAALLGFIGLRRGPPLSS